MSLSTARSSYDLGLRIREFDVRYNDTLLDPIRAAVGNHVWTNKNWSMKDIHTIVKKLLDEQYANADASFIADMSKYCELIAYDFAARNEQMSMRMSERLFSRQLFAQLERDSRKSKTK